MSEMMRTKPNRNVQTWFDGLGSKDWYVSVLTIGEIRFGVERISESDRRIRLKRWLDRDLLLDRSENILPVTVEVAERWGLLKVAEKRTLPEVDSLIAATALHHRLILVTRNTKDFQFPGLEVVDPFV